MNLKSTSETRFGASRRLPAVSKILSFVVFLFSSTLHATTFSEYFDYGLNTVPGTADTLTDEAAWGGSDEMGYLDGGNLTYTAPGYSNLNAGTGSAVRRTGSNRDVVTSHTFDTELTGTVWMSLLYESTPEVNTIFKWSSETSDTNGIRFYNKPEVWYGGTTTGSAPTDLYGRVNLVLIKLDMNVSGGTGTSDSLDVWFNPDLSGGFSTIGAANVSGTGAEIGTGISSISITTQNFDASYPARFDAIRVSNEVNGFEYVTIPEPSTLLLFGLALGSVLLFRRRKG